MSALIERIFTEMPGRYRVGSASGATYYFSIGDRKYTVTLTADACVVAEGKGETKADYVQKTPPELFDKMVIMAKRPGPIDIAGGRIKTHDPMALGKLRDYFDFSGV
jgi:hypothetical protein